MHPIDSLAPLAIQVLILLGLVLLVVELAGAVRRRRADPWRALARRHRSR